jgi:YVTN family beta-propeller protein
MYWSPVTGNTHPLLKGAGEMRREWLRSIDRRWLVAVAVVAGLASLLTLTIVSVRRSRAGRPPGLSAPEDLGIARSRTNAVLLVSNARDSALTFVELGTGRILGNTDTGPLPREIAVTPDGRTAFVVNEGGDDGVSVIDVAARREIRKIELGRVRDPQGIQVSGDGTRLYVTAQAEQAVLEIDVATGKVLRTLATGQESRRLVLAPDGRTLYTANGRDGTVTVLDLDQGTPVAQIATGRGCASIDITPDGRTVWAVNWSFDTVSVVDTKSFTVVAKLPRPVRPSLVKITPDGRTALVACGYADRHLGAVIFYDVATRRELGSVNAGPIIAMAIDPAGQTAYAVRTDSDDILVIDLRERAVVRTIAGAGHGPCGLGIAVPR